MICQDEFWTSMCPCCAPPSTSCPASDRSCDVQSYVQTITGALIRPACSSTNPGIQGAMLPLPNDHLPRGDTDPVDLMSTPRGCLGAMVESRVLSQRYGRVCKRRQLGGALGWDRFSLKLLKRYFTHFSMQ